MNRLSANLLLLFVGLIWGLGFVAQQTAMDDIGPLQFVAVRFLIAFLVVAPFAYAETRRYFAQPNATPLTFGDMALIANVGLMFFLGMAFQQVGLLGTTVTNSGMLTGLYVVIVPMIAALFFGQNQPRVIWGAAAIAFAGIWFLGGGSLDGFNWGDVLTIICAVFNALQVILVGKAVNQIKRPVFIATIQFGLSGVLGFVCFAFARSIDWSLEPEFTTDTLLQALPAVLYAAIVAGGLAFTLQAVAQRYTRPADAAILLSSEALFAALGGMVILAERLNFIGYLGCGLLLSAIVIVSVISAKLEAQALKTS